MYQFNVGDTSKSIDIFIQDSTSTTGAGLTALTYTSGQTAYYRKGQTGSWTSIVLATQTIGGAYSSGGFVKGDDTNAPGMYRFDIPDTCLAAAGNTFLYFQGATHMVPVVVGILVLPYPAGAIPNAAANAAGGLLISTAGGVDMDDLAADVDELITTIGAAGAGLTGIPDSPTVATVAGANGVETGVTLKSALRGIFAAETGLVSGAGTGTITISAGGTGNSGTTRLTATVSGGNRTSITYNL